MSLAAAKIVKPVHREEEHPCRRARLIQIAKLHASDQESFGSTSCLAAIKMATLVLRW
jgi:hypothetical protein